MLLVATPYNYFKLLYYYSHGRIPKDVFAVLLYKELSELLLFIVLAPSPIVNNHMYIAMKYLLLCIGFLIIQPTDSFGLTDLTINHLPHSLLIGVGVSACILPACYIFYPAYCANVEGELGCTCTVLAGQADEKKGSQGERYIRCI